MKKSLFSSLIFFSLLYLCYYLYKNDLFIIPKIHNYLLFVFSCLALLFANAFQAINWKTILSFSSVDITYKDSFKSIGLSILTKYIPGKVWLILGRSEYIAQKYNQSSGNISIISLQLQLMIIWSGLLIGIIAILCSPPLENFEYKVTAIITFIVLGVICFSPYVLRAISKLAEKIFKKKIEFIHSLKSYVLLLTPILVIYWLLFTFAFYCFGNSIISPSEHFSFGAALSYPVAGALGIATIFMPGGIGVREGIMTAYLSLLGLELEFAISLSVLSRLWFIFIEVIFFLIALILEKIKV